jgi:hypothetical protein
MAMPSHRSPASPLRRRTGPVDQLHHLFFRLGAFRRPRLLNPSTTLDVGYRYLNAGQITKLIKPQTGLTLRQNNISQQLLVGIRYVLQ